MHHRIRSMLIRPASDKETDEHIKQWYDGELSPAGAYYSICTLVETDDSFLHTTETCHERQLLIQVGQVILGEIPELAFPEEHTGQQALVQAQDEARGRAEEATPISEVEAQAEAREQELGPWVGTKDEDLPDEEEQDDNLP